MLILRRSINGLNLIAFNDPSDLMIYDHYTSDPMTYDLKYLIEPHDSTSFY
jgi:hypothetical protein